MSIATMFTVALTGDTGHLVQVEAHARPGPGPATIAGLPHDTCDRVHAAILHATGTVPADHVTVTLYPAVVPPADNPGLDLAIATAALAAMDVLPISGLHHTVIIGHLGYDGRVQPVPDILGLTMAGYLVGMRRAIVPVPNAEQASSVPGMIVRAVDTLHRLVTALCDRQPIPIHPHATPAFTQQRN